MELLRVFFFSTLILVFSGCLKTRNELSESEEKKAYQVQVQDLQKQKADADAQLIGMEERFRALHGRLETLEFQNSQNARIREEQEQRLAALDSRIKSLEEGILQLGQELELAKAAPPPAPPKKESKGGAFEEAESLFDDKEWKKAVAAYSRYRDANPKGEHFATATYKIGVCLTELKMTKEARVFFEEVIERFPKTKTARAASFRLQQLKKKSQ